MTREEQITKAALDYANNLPDVPIKDAFSWHLAIAIGQAFIKGAEWADNNPNHIEETFGSLMAKNELPIVKGFDGITGKQTDTKWLVCVHQNKKCKYQVPVGDGAFLICNNYPKCLNIGCEIELNNE